MSNIEITAFNPFALQSGPTTTDQGQEQEIIYYCESRFRQALLSMSKAPAIAQRWMQRCLQIELVCFLFTIGMSALRTD